MNNKNVIRLAASESFTAELALKYVMRKCYDQDVQDVLIVGYDSGGSLISVSSRMTRADALFLLEKAKEWVMQGGIE
jgi:hypothetical protein